MGRQLDIDTLQIAARHFASEWMRDDRKNPSRKLFIGGPSYVLQEFYNFSYKDEFERLVNADDGIKAWLSGKALADFETRSGKVFSPRDDAVFANLLREKLAIDPDGNHIDGVIGTVQVGVRPIAKRIFNVEARDSIARRKRLGLSISDGADEREMIQAVRLLVWPVYAGEAEERAAESSSPDVLPEDAMPTLPDGRRPGGVGATNPNISAESAIAALDAIVDSLDEGSTAATIRGRTGAQPDDPDDTESGTLLFTLTMSDPAFGAASDDTPGAIATAETVTDDASADATGTLGYCRAGATGTGADDHIDGSAGTSDADFIFNTLAIVSGATVSMSSFTVSLPQGSSAA